MLACDVDTKYIDCWDVAVSVRSCVRSIIKNAAGWRSRSSEAKIVSDGKQLMKCECSRYWARPTPTDDVMQCACSIISTSGGTCASCLSLLGSTCTKHSNAVISEDFRLGQHGVRPRA